MQSNQELNKQNLIHRKEDHMVYPVPLYKTNGPPMHFIKQIFLRVKTSLKFDNTISNTIGKFSNKLSKCICLYIFKKDKIKNILNNKTLKNIKAIFPSNF